MTEIERDGAALAAQIESLKQTLESLEQSAALGVDVSAAIAGIQAKLVELRDVQGDVTIGTKNVGTDQRGQTIHGTQINAARDVILAALPDNSAAALEKYRRDMARECGHLSLRGVDRDEADAAARHNPLGLANVYIELHTATQIPLSAEERGREENRWRDTRPQTALEAVLENRELVLLGDPGGGKTTFVRHLAHCLARGETASLAGWREDMARVPILVILRDFARRLPQLREAQADKEPWAYLLDFIDARLRERDLAEAIAPLHDLLDAGDALVLLDGLDEVTTTAQRVFVRDAVQGFVRRYSDSRYLITCRVLSYREPNVEREEPDLRLPRFATRTLAKFDDDQIDNFITAWYAELARVGRVRAEDVAGLQRDLRDAVRRRDLRRMAPNPLLLTVMALVHTHSRLPDERALLYAEAVDILLWRWDQVKMSGDERTPRLRELLRAAGRSDKELLKVLARLAYEAHAQLDEPESDADGDSLAGIGELKLEKSLAALHKGDRTWAHEMIQAMKLRAGLLLEREHELFTFPHRTFQEYLAGVHLAEEGDFAPDAAKLAAEGALWREVILLAVGHLVYHLGKPSIPLGLVPRLCPKDAVDDAAHWRAAWLAGDVLGEIGINRVTDDEWGAGLLARVRERLTRLITRGKLPPVERARAGQALAILGDERDFDELVEVPAGVFLIGSTDADEWADNDEKPQHEVDLPAFKIGKYSVTNGQYAAFVAAGGYDNRAYWGAAGWEWKEKENWTAPRDFGVPFNLPNHPVVGVSWYEACAYCAWLTETWRGAGVIAPNEVVRLPTEAEWEKAARGRDGRVWSWGNEWDAAKCNNIELEVNSTSAVGMFPTGASPYGCLDMLGNVDEWTMSLWRDYPYRGAEWREGLEKGEDSDRVVRGGAFLNVQNIARCAYRNRDLPFNRFSHLGFRCVVSPISPTSAL